MIVGEALDERSQYRGRAFAGPSEQILHGILKQAGIEKQSCYFTNVFNLQPHGGSIKAFCGGKAEAIAGYRALGQNLYVKESYRSELRRLYLEIALQQPNLIIALGNAALWALCKKVGIKKYRGSPLSTFDLSPEFAAIPELASRNPRPTYKVIPTWAPISVLKQWELRVVMLADFSKAKREAAFPELNRPSHRIYMQPSLSDIADFYSEFLVGQPYLSCDIETKAMQITEVGYSTADGSRALVIPFWDREHPTGNYWPDLESELAAWSWVRRINSEFPLIGQNFSYDMKYFWKAVGIPCPHFHGDTMLLHHSLQPELEKGLGFLASIYTNEPSWKFMRADHDTLKKED